MTNTLNLKGALAEAFNARGFDSPRIVMVSEVLADREWLGATVTAWIRDGVLRYSIRTTGNSRMRRQGGRLKAIRAAAKAMGLLYREET